MISPVCSAIGTNSAGSTRPELRVVPAGERLDADDPPRAQVGLRLVGEHQLAGARSRRAARRRSPAGAGCGGPGSASNSAYPPGARLGRVHRDVGALDQRLDVVAVLGMAGDADRARRPASVVASTGTARAGAPAGLGDDARLRGAGDAVEHDAELVAAEPRDRVARAQRAAQARGDLLQQPVAWWWPSVSLISLKWLRSISITASRAVARARCGSPARRGRGTATRLGSPVSASWTRLVLLRDRVRGRRGGSRRAAGRGARPSGSE